MSANMSESSGTGDAPSTRPHGRRSKVWEHFEQDLVFVGDVPKAVCKYCAMKFTCNRKSGTSSLLSHISESCRLIEAEARSRFLATLKKKSTDVGFVFDRKRSRQLMTKFCIHAEIPFKKFDDPYFEDLTPTCMLGTVLLVPMVSGGGLKMVSNRKTEMDWSGLGADALWAGADEHVYSQEGYCVEETDDGGNDYPV
uniref:Uncharacterized protein n=2 Tax=Avena sativa TaxID=4498 RepID=A0ACD5UM14_AVESA